MAKVTEAISAFETNALREEPIETALSKKFLMLPTDLSLG